jgi:hypothetical protein
MDFDDLVVGSGLAALGAVLGLCRHGGRRVGVLCGAAQGHFEYYDALRTVPCAFLGAGGLGSHWHGVIPTGRRQRLPGATDAAFLSMFRHFYPHADIAARMGQPGQFVPWRPIRPMPEFQRLARSAKPAGLHLLPETATALGFGSAGATVATARGRHSAHRVWLAAGALHTPALLAQSFAADVVRGQLSDHVFCYVGQLQGDAGPRVQIGRDGIFLQGWAAAGGDTQALYTLRPAMFAFRRLDHGIEQRAVFGLPTGHLMAKLVRRLSPGLLVEAVYNRFGMPATADRHSVYAQVHVRDAYAPARNTQPLQALGANIRRATDAARAAQPFAGLRPSQRPELALPGIHLHHSLDTAVLARLGIDQPGSPLQVVDASTLADIGPEHHSFEMMVSACERAAAAGAGP